MRGHRQERRNPSIEALRALLALHEEGSVRAAARKLGQAQSVVSRKLEVFLTADACGAILLKKASDSLVLTSAGLSAVPSIRELVQRYDQLLGFLRGIRSDPHLVRIAVGSFAAQHYVPRALAMIRDSDASCEIETRIARGEDRTETVNQFVDVRFAKRFRVGTSRYEATVDAFNGLNANHVLLQTEAIGAAWARPSRILAPRIIRFGLTARF
jgi:DNA-binding transcriptional LysR family regulator